MLLPKLTSRRNLRFLAPLGMTHAPCGPHKGMKMTVGLPTVTPAKAGVHTPPLDSGLQPNDKGGEIARGHLYDNLGEVAALVTGSGMGLLLDMDGTLSEIVPVPEEATVSPAIRSTLDRLLHRLPLVAVITGRSATQARDIVGIRQLVYVGNHGLERLEGERFTLAEEVRPFVPYLEQLMARVRDRISSEGITLEDKGSSFAIHYRNAENPGKAQQDVLNIVREMSGDRVRVLTGKAVINVLPPVALTKGDSVASLVKEYGLSGAILIGDDVTDIDSFRAANRLSGQQGFKSISIAVVGPDSPEELERLADFTVAGVSEVEDFLDWLVEQTVDSL